MQKESLRSVLELIKSICMPDPKSLFGLQSTTAYSTERGFSIVRNKKILPSPKSIWDLQAFLLPVNLWVFGWFGFDPAGLQRSIHAGCLRTSPRVWLHLRQSGFGMIQGIAGRSRQAYFDRRHKPIVRNPYPPSIKFSLRERRGSLHKRPQPLGKFRKQQVHYD